MAQTWHTKPFLSKQGRFSSDMSKEDTNTFVLPLVFHQHNANPLQHHPAVQHYPWVQPHRQNSSAISVCSALVKVAHIHDSMCLWKKGGCSDVHLSGIMFLWDLTPLAVGRWSPCPRGGLLIEIPSTQQV